MRFTAATAAVLVSSAMAGEISTDYTTQMVTITDCPDSVTDCPAHSKTSSVVTSTHFLNTTL